MGGGGLLVVTSVAIAIPVVLASSNSDEQTLKNAQVALENLTIDQKTVNLTKVTNQKLPSAFKISSMETLNALLKKAITTLNGITYQLWVIKTDNTKGEMVVEIEIKKGTVNKTVNFTIVGFKTTTKATLNEEAKTLDKSNFYYDGKAFDMSQNASFYDDKAKVSGVKLSKYTLLTASQVEEISKATLKITYTLKNGQTSSGTQTFSYSGFNKLQDQKDDVATAKVVLANLTNTNILDQSKTPSQVSYDNVADFFKKTALDAPSGEDATTLSKVTIIIAGAPKGDTSQIVVFTISSKVSGASATSELEVTGFKSLLLVQKEVDVAAAKAIIDSLVNTNILDHSQSASQVSYESLDDFFEKTALDVPSEEDAIALNKVNIVVEAVVKDNRSQTIIFTISSKPIGKTDRSTLIVNQFKEQVLAQKEVDVAAAKIVLANLPNTNILNNSQSASQVSYESLEDFFEKTALDAPSGEDATALSKVTITIAQTIKDDTFQTVTFTISSEPSGASDTIQHEVTGFKSQILVQSKVDVDEALAKITNDTIKGDHSQLPSQMSAASIKALLGFPTTTSNGVHFDVEIKTLSANDINSELTFTLIAMKNTQSAPKNITIRGFKELNQDEKDVAIIKKFIDDHGDGTINDKTKFADEVIFFRTIWHVFNYHKTSLKMFLWRPKGFSESFDRVTLTYKEEIDSSDDAKKILTTTISSNNNNEVTATSTTIISGFASLKQVQVVIDAAKVLLDNLDEGTINSNANSASQVTYKDIANLIEQTNLENFNPDEQAIIDQVTITIATEPKDDTSKTVTLTIAKHRGSSVTSIIEISGFASQGQFDINNALAKITNNTIKGDSTKLPSQMDMSSIKALPGFPPPSNGVHFDIQEKTLIDNEGIHYDMSGKLIIILRASKNGINQTKELTISGFQTRPQSAYQDDVVKALAKITNNTIKGDSSQLPSVMDVDSIKALSGFPPISSNGVHFDVEIKTLSASDGTSTDISGALIITLRASISGESQTKEIIISGFKRRSLTQDESDVANDLAKATISGDLNKLPSTMDVDSVKALSSFPTTTSNDVHFDVELVQSNNEYGTLTITLIATKKGATKKQELTISGFQTQAQAQVIANKQAVDNYQKLIGNVSETTTTTPNRRSNEYEYGDMRYFNDDTNVNLEIPPSNINVVINSRNENRQKVVTFTISKGDYEVTHQITVTGFLPN